MSNNSFPKQYKFLEHSFLEEGTFFSSYSAMGYANINNTNQTLVLGQVARYVVPPGTRGGNPQYNPFSVTDVDDHDFIQEIFTDAAGRYARKI